MGRKRVDIIRDAFRYNNDTDRSTCKKCGKLFSGSHITNLRRHLKNNHPEIIDILDQDNEEKEEDIPPTKKKSIQIEMTEEIVTNACIDFITTEAHPLKFLDSPSLHSILDPIFNSLKMAPITSKNIMSMAESKIDIMINSIKKLYKKKLISLKIDSATRHNRSLFCVNIQTIQGKHIIVKTLGVVIMNGRQTAENLKLEIKNILTRYDINFDQVYSITSDNGRNMIKTVELIDEENREEDIEDINLFIEDMDSLNLRTTYSVRCAAHILQLAVLDFFKNSNIEQIINESRNVIKLLRTPAHRYSILEQNLTKPILDVPTRWTSTYDMLQRLLKLKHYCDTYVNDISVENWIKIQKLTDILNPVKLTTLKLQREQLTLGDFVKLWWELKLQFRAQSTGCVLSEIFFKSIENREGLLLNNSVVQAAIFLDPRIRKLLPLHKEVSAKNHLEKLILQIQKIKQQNTNDALVMKTQLEDPFRISPVITTELEDPAVIKTELEDPAVIKTELEDPPVIKTKLEDPPVIKTELENPPVIKIELGDPFHISPVIKTELEDPLYISAEQSISRANSNIDPSLTSTNVSLLDQYLHSEEENDVTLHEDVNGNENLRESVLREINTFSPRKIKLDKDILVYWEEQKFNFPLLNEAAKIIYAVPATQVTVERAFSAIKLVLSDLSLNLNSEHLEKIILIKLNNKNS